MIRVITSIPNIEWDEVVQEAVNFARTKKRELRLNQADSVVIGVNSNLFYEIVENYNWELRAQLLLVDPVRVLAYILYYDMADQVSEIDRAYPHIHRHNLLDALRRNEASELGSIIGGLFNLHKWEVMMSALQKRIESCIPHQLTLEEVLESIEKGGDGRE